MAIHTLHAAHHASAAAHQAPAAARLQALHRAHAQHATEAHTAGKPAGDTVTLSDAAKAELAKAHPAEQAPVAASATAQVGGGQTAAPSTETTAPATETTAAQESAPAQDLTRQREFLRERAYGLNADGSHRPLTDEEETKMAQSMAGFNDEALDDLRKNDVHYALVDPQTRPEGGYPGRPDWKQWDPGVGAYYSHSVKTVVVPPNNMTAEFVAHETGHALNMCRQDNPPAEKDSVWNVLAGGLRVDRDPHGGWHLDTPAESKARVEQSQRDTQLEDMFNQYKARTESPEGREKNLVTDYGRTNPQEYLAEGVGEYMSSPERREALRQKDPALYAYVQTLVHEDKR